VTPPLQLADAAPAPDRFLVYSMHYSYADGADVHGFPQEAHLKLTGEPSTQLLRGNIFGGSAAAVLAAVAEFDRVLTETLQAGYMVRARAAALSVHRVGGGVTVMRGAGHGGERSDG